ncbi:MAG: hypothetical protein P4L93_10290 [Coriobacteriia bacterium]|nr:hypothetical protein [Coriobacteriia bacterium]
MSQAALSTSTPVGVVAERSAIEQPTSAAEAVAIAEPDTPPVMDTYSLVYAFSWAFLIPGLALLNTQPFRTYDFAYVTYVTLPFVLGVVATFLTDSRDRGLPLALRIGILTPLALVTGTGVLWTLALTTMPISPYLEPQNYVYTTPIFVALLFAIAGPLAWSVWRRATRGITWQSAVQLLVLIVAIVSVIWVGYMMFQPDNALRSFARKDITIYVTGSLMWYLPSFGFAAGVWRKLGLV